MHDLINWQHRAADGITLRGWRTTPRGLPVLFFLHGNGLCGMTYWPMLRHLRDAFDLVLLDAPGHGLSDALAAFQGWPQDAARCHAAWLSIAADYPEAGRHLLAHSYGGVLATLMMAENPATFRSAVLLDPVYFPPGMLLLGRALSLFGLLRFTKQSRTTCKRRDRWPSREAAREHLGARRVYREWESDCLDAFIQHGLRDCDDGVGVRLRCLRELEADIFGSLPFGLPRALGQLRTPCVAFSGDRSYGFVVSALPKYSAAHSCLEHREIAGGHNFMLEETQRTAERVREVLLAETM